MDKLIEHPHPNLPPSRGKGQPFSLVGRREQGIPVFPIMGKEPVPSPLAGEGQGEGEGDLLKPSSG
jgi:hypothetical protein